MTAAVVLVSAVVSTVVTILLGLMGSRLNRRPARAPEHVVYILNGHHQGEPQYVLTSCRCIVGVDHNVKGQPIQQEES